MKKPPLALLLLPAILLGLSSVVPGQATAPKKPAEKSWAHDPSEFAGLKFGASPEEVAKVLKLDKGQCDLHFDADGPRISACKLVDSSIEGVPVLMLARFLDSHLAGVTFGFASKDFVTLRDALTAKFGKPSNVERPAFTTQEGRAMKNENVDWTGVDMDLNISQFGDDVDHGIGGILTRAMVDEEVRASEKK